MNIAMLDIETSNLDPNFGIMACVCIKELGKKPEVLRIDHYPEWDGEADFDAGLVKDLVERCSGFNPDGTPKMDMLVTWFGKWFDIAYINAKAIKYRQRPLTNTHLKHLDLWKVARSKLKMSNNRLGTWQDFLNLPDEKTPIRADLWIAAARGKSKALDEIVHHCKKDVIVLEEVYQRFRPLIDKIPMA